MLRSPRLIIFDCDGVLVDSEPIAIAVLRETIARAGREIDEETAYRRFLGRSMATIRDIVATDFGVRIGDAELAAMRTELQARFRRDLKPISGIAATLDALDLPFCVASSSQPERIRLSLGVTGLLAFFEPNIYSSSMVANGKPAPDLFLHAAAEMRFEPGECLVIEDSPAGIEAACRAGMRVFAFTGGAHALGGAQLAANLPYRPDLVFDDMRALPGLLVRPGAGKPAA